MNVNASWDGFETDDPTLKGNRLAKLNLVKFVDSVQAHSMWIWPQLEIFLFIRTSAMMTDKYKIKLIVGIDLNCQVFSVNNPI